MQPAAAETCHEGMAKLLGVVPPPLSIQAVSDDQGPPALAVFRSVPPTEVRKESSAGQTKIEDFHLPLSPEAVKKLCHRWPDLAASMPTNSSIGSSTDSPLPWH